MKDDFYKDKDHSRTDKKKVNESTHKEKNQEPKQEEFKRTSRYKTKDNENMDSNSSDQSNHNEKDNIDKPKKVTPILSNYINKEQLNKGKVYFKGKYDEYKGRLDDEINMSKEKFNSIKESRTKKSGDLNEESRNERNLLPLIIAGIIILPLSLLLAFLIFSNFWPSGDNESRNVASSNEETVEEDENVDTDSEEIENYEAQRRELEERLEQSRQEDDSTESTEDSSYSDDEIAQLEQSAQNAIDEKQNSSDNSNSTTEQVEEPPQVNNYNEPEDNSSQQNVQQEQNNTENNETETNNSNIIATHTIQPGENVYRLAIRYYGSGSSENIRKILDANNVNANEISVGTNLVIPE